MANFVLLYSGGGMPESAAEQAAVLQAWGAWFGKLGSDLVDGGNPFSPQVKHIANDGTVGDGPVGSMATGYSIIKAGSLSEAVEKARGCPLLGSGGGQISVYETSPAM